MLIFFFIFFFFNDTATTEIYTLSLHDALPISLEISESGTADAAERKSQRVTKEDRRVPPSECVEGPDSRSGECAEEPRWDRQGVLRRTGLAPGPDPHGSHDCRRNPGHDQRAERVRAERVRIHSDRRAAQPALRRPAVHPAHAPLRRLAAQRGLHPEPGPDGGGRHHPAAAEYRARGRTAARHQPQ